VGKATLARRFAARLLGDGDRIEKDDLSLAHNLESIAERERWPPTAGMRTAAVLFAPGFRHLRPDGPLRQLSIPQMRLLKERAQFKRSRALAIFLIDQIDRAKAGGQLAVEDARGAPDH